jgi:cyclase
VTSVDREGTGKGFDLPLVEQLSRAVPLPVIAGGGMGEIGHLEAVVKQGGADAVAMAHVLHYDKLSVDQIRQGALARGVAVRRVVA